MLKVCSSSKIPSWWNTGAKIYSRLVVNNAYSPSLLQYFNNIIKSPSKILAVTYFYCKMIYCNFTVNWFSRHRVWTIFCQKAFLSFFLISTDSYSITHIPAPICVIEQEFVEMRKKDKKAFWQKIVHSKSFYSKKM